MFCTFIINKINLAFLQQANQVLTDHYFRFIPS